MPDPFVCPSTTGPGPCMNEQPHEEPHGCVHHSTSAWSAGGKNRKGDE